MVIIGIGVKGFKEKANFLTLQYKPRALFYQSKNEDDEEFVIPMIEGLQFISFNELQGNLGTSLIDISDY